MIRRVHEGKEVLDVCCGSKMMWFDPEDERALYVDIRRETYELNDASTKSGTRDLVIDPDIEGDFTALDFDDDTFSLVVFDPPHLERAGKTSWMAKKYGKLEGNWRQDLRQGFIECFRVLKPLGTLIFKWNETQIPVSEILKLTSERPLFGQRCGKQAKTHWIVFIKPDIPWRERVHAQGLWCDLCRYFKATDVDGESVCGLGRNPDFFHPGDVTESAESMFGFYDKDCKYREKGSEI